MQQARIIKDGKFESSTSRSQQKIPVVDIENSTPMKGSIAYNRESSGTYPLANSIYYANGTEWLPVSPVTTLTAGTGLVGTLVGTDVVISMPNVGTAGTYDFSDSFTTDLQGRVSSVSTGFLTGSTSGSKFFGPATTLTNLGATALPWQYIYGQKAHIGLPNFTGVNDARLRLVGSANSINGGPNTEMYISSSVHPIKQTSGFSSGNISECYDCYFNGTNFVSSIPTGGSCVQLYKSPSENFQMNSIRSPSLAGDSVSTITSGNSNALTMTRDASIFIRKQISENSTSYSTGTASQSGQIVDGSGTNWINGMVGGLIVYSTGQHCLIIEINSPVQLLVNATQTVPAGTSYILYYGANQMSRGSGSQVNQYLTGSQIFVGTDYNITITKENPISGQTITVPDIGSPLDLTQSTFALYTAKLSTGPINSSGAIVRPFTLFYRRQGIFASLVLADDGVIFTTTASGTINFLGIIPVGYRPLADYLTPIIVYLNVSFTTANMRVRSNGDIIISPLIVGGVWPLTSDIIFSEIHIWHQID